MKNYLILYYAPKQAITEQSFEIRKKEPKEIEKWTIWQDSLKDNLVNLGSSVMGAYRINSDKKETYKQSEIVGFSIIQAKNPKDAEKQIQEHPHLEFVENGAIEIFECND